jgi:hypothetical protein
MAPNNVIMLGKYIYRVSEFEVNSLELWNDLLLTRCYEGIST